DWKSRGDGAGSVSPAGGQFQGSVGADAEWRRGRLWLPLRPREGDDLAQETDFGPRWVPGFISGRSRSGVSRSSRNSSTWEGERAPARSPRSIQWLSIPRASPLAHLERLTAKNWAG